MAKDCSELAVLINDAALNLAARSDIIGIEGITKILKKDLPNIVGDDVAEAIVAANRRTTTAERSELANKISQIKGEAKLNQAVRKLEEHLESGTLPQKAKKRQAFSSEEVKNLRAVKKELQKELRGSDAAKIERINKQIDFLNEKIASGIKLPEPRVIAQGSDELERLIFQRNQIRRQINQEIQSLKPQSVFKKFFTEPLNAARAVIASTDFSAALRQGGFIAFGNPKRALKNFPDMFRALSEKQAIKIQEAIQARPNAPLYARSKLHLGEISGSLTGREELFATTMLDKFAARSKIGKVLTAPVRASGRTFTIFLNKLRADTFDAMTRSLAKNGTPTPEEMNAIANFVNVATGRGTAQSLEPAMNVLNTIFFAPRYVTSRFQLIAGTPLFKKNAGNARKLIAKEYAKSLIGLGAFYSMVLGAKEIAGADITIESDPRSSDFGKIKIGNTRIDPLFGIAQTATILSRVGTGKVKSLKTGKVTSLTDAKFGARDIPSILGTFIRTKLAPVTSIPLNIIAGENVIGEKVTPLTTLRDLTVPLSLRDISEAIEEQGLPKGSAIGLVAIFGMGVQVFDVNRRREPRKRER